MKGRWILQGRPFGHPLHPLLVHLPLGLWLLALILDIVSFSDASNGWAREGAFWALAIGTGVALVAAVAGYADWLDIRADQPAQNAAIWHMALMFPATVIFAIDTVLHRIPITGFRVGGVALGLTIAGNLLTMVGGYLGGLMVYGDGIAVGRHRRKTELPRNTILEPRRGTTEVGLAPHVGLPAEFHPVIPEAALREGETLRAEVEGAVMALVRSNGLVYAVQEFCTHRCGPLSEGRVEANQIRCPWHNSCFDLATGKVTHGPARVDLKTYDVRVHEGIIHVRVRGAQAEPEARREEPRVADRRNPQEVREPVEPPQQREEAPRRLPRE